MIWHGGIRAQLAPDTTSFFFYDAAIKNLPSHWEEKIFIKISIIFKAKAKSPESI